MSEKQLGQLKTVLKKFQKANRQLLLKWNSEDDDDKEDFENAHNLSLELKSLLFELVQGKF